MGAKRLVLSISCVLQAGCLLAPARAQDSFGRVPESSIVNFANIGADQKEALRVNHAIYQGIGFANTFMVITPAGNVIVDTSSVNRAPKHKELLSAVSDAPARYIILTHGHGDHTGGVHLWKGDQTDIITQRNFPEFCAYQDRLAPFFARNNAAQFNFDEARLVELARSPKSKVVPTITFDDRYEFELGSVEFEVFATPSETPDALSVWLPKHRAVFVGDLMYDSFPNIYTLRGTPPRWALEYVDSLNKVLALEPEILLPSHGLAIVGKEKVKQAVTKYRDAIQFVHDATVQGMNDGKDVFTLMREIKLPAELDVGESYGKVSWSVRGIYDGYVGWFDRNPATMYGRSPNVADAELVELAGGASAVAARSQSISEAGDPVKGLRMADAALAYEPTSQAALEAKLLALKTLQKQTRNGLEHAWLGFGIREVEKVLGESSTTKSSATP
ncbi:MAG: alkyl sulfatase dimerization domain-containing protein [Pirellulales bacterium]